MSNTSSSISRNTTDNANNTQKFFNGQYYNQIAYRAEDVDTAIGFFLKRGFDKVAATNTALVLLQQASVDKVPIFKLLDTLTGVNDVQLSYVVAQVLNLNRAKCSVVGYRISSQTNRFDQRNIIV